MMGATVAPTPELRTGLKEYAWTEDDGLIRRYIYAFDETLEHRMKLYDFWNSQANVIKQEPWCAFGFPVLSWLACHVPICNLIEGTPCHSCFEMKRTMYYENEIEEIYSRRVGNPNPTAL